jgi:GNAT superfamily N-acetyltransferase
MIRKGTEKDMPAVLDLIKELAAFEREPDAVVLTVDDLARDGFGLNPLFDTYVADVEGEIVGMALFYFRYSTWKGRTLHLEDLIVKMAHRGKGFGLALFQEVMFRATAEGVRRAEWNVLSWNEDAIQFYEKSAGFVVPDWRVVHRVF